MRHLLIFLFIFSVFSVNAQNETVQSFNYESTTRDTVIKFPDSSHNDYERILMHYSMRCTDGLVSTGTQRNLGCGEWDYSCNTYIVDSTRIDSLKATSPDFILPGFSGNTFNYTSIPTYSYYQTTQTEVSYNNIITEKIFPFDTANSTLNHPFGKISDGFSMKYILKKDDLINSNVEEDDITGISFNSDGGDILLENLRVRMAHTTDNAIYQDEVSNYDWQQVYFYDTQLNNDDNLIRFYDNFEWDGSMNVAVELSYTKATGQDLNVKSSAQDYDASLIVSQSNNNYLHVGSSGNIHREGGLESISEEITVSFWQFGDMRMPVNSTIFEGRDNSNRRQVNVHLPWSDSQVYWDCGNDGGGYDRINKSANAIDFKDQWNHWAFTKNASSGEMAIYLNGVLWQSGTGKYRSIDLKELNVGSAIISSSLFYYGNIDEFKIWNKALNSEEIQSGMYSRINDTHPDFDRLVLYYDFDNMTDSEVMDRSSLSNNGIIEGRVQARTWLASQNIVDANTEQLLPDMNIHQGLYFARTTDIIKVDSIMNLPQKVDRYSVTGTDLNYDGTDYLYEAGSFPVIDEEGKEVGTVEIPVEDSINIGSLEYFNKSPMAFEIMSFVTPYGIGLDFGLEGLTWTFDVTQFGPILKGNKRMYMSRGGQWQEDMDIQFEFIEGTPDRDVIDIQQVWPVTQTAYGQIQQDWRFEPRSFTYDQNIHQYILNTSISGHGQEGEFIPRNHVMDIGGFTESWQVWKECGENPVFPQGGTWVYDRAGWCPGMETDVRTLDVTEYFQFLQNPIVDYTVPVASGNSRYIVNAQLIQYGPPNKTLDASIKEVVIPTTNIVYGKLNPTCNAPRVILMNNGADNISSATIEYGIVGKSKHTQEWTGSLDFLLEDEVRLDYIPDFLFAEEGDLFYARVTSVNNTNDLYINNDEYISEIVPVNHYDSDIIIEFRTNSRPNETSYEVYDFNGNRIHWRTVGNLSANTTYRDTLKDLDGCYKILVSDFDNDGLSWWANNDGNGYVRIRSVGSNYDEIATDFGSFIDYNFTAGMLTDSEEVLLDTDLGIFPNPSIDGFHIEGLEEWNSEININIADQMGRTVKLETYNKIDLQKGVYNLDLLPGIYIINLNDGDKRASVKWIKLQGE